MEIKNQYRHSQAKASAQKQNHTPRAKKGSFCVMYSRSIDTEYITSIKSGGMKKDAAMFGLSKNEMLLGTFF